MEILKNVYKMLKVRQYIKNLIIFLPAVFTHNLSSFSNLFEVVKVCVAFCLISSAVYIFNDLKDVHEDKKHPIKRHRPIASGKISPLWAKISFGILILLVLFLGQFMNAACNICLWLYLILNICYSLWLRNMKYVDMVCIAFGFVLRISAGFCAVKEPLFWSMAIFVFVTSIFFTASKRFLEQKFLPNIASRRQSMRYFQPDLLNKVLYSSALLSVLCYVLLTKQFDAYIPMLHITSICFVVFIARLLYLINKTKDHDDPMNFMMSDRWIKIISVFSLFILAVIYIG